MKARPNVVESEQRADLEARYADLTEQLSEPLHLADPWDLTLDTGKLTV